MESVRLRRDAAWGSYITEEYLARHPRSFDVRLRDGRRVRIRPLVPQDRVDITRGIERVYQTTHPFHWRRTEQHDRDAELGLLAEAVQGSHRGWGAIALDEPGRPGIGVARFIRTPDDPWHARVAIGIVADYDGVELGRVLLQTLLVGAAEAGLRTLLADVSPANAVALKLFKAAGADAVESAGDAVRLAIPVSQPLRTYRNSGQFRIPRRRPVRARPAVRARRGAPRLLLHLLRGRWKIALRTLRRGLRSQVRRWLPPPTRTGSSTGDLVR
jgi:GNAT acetyltransferase-like protein